MQDEIKSTRGGARAGAGRKRGENSRNIRVSFMLSPLADTALKDAAQREGVSRNDIVNRLLESMAGTPKES